MLCIKKIFGDNNYLESDTSYNFKRIIFKDISFSYVPISKKIGDIMVYSDLLATVRGAMIGMSESDITDLYGSPDLIPEESEYRTLVYFFEFCFSDDPFLLSSVGMMFNFIEDRVVSYGIYLAGN